jgi:hypothetical protein
MIATILTAIALIASLGFNYLQYTWRKEEREQHEQERDEAKAEQLRKESAQLGKERMPPEFYNQGGAPNPIRITGSQHSVNGPFVDVWGAITVVNPTQSHMKITPDRLVIDGVQWEVARFTFHLKANSRERYERISLVGNDKQDYDLHFLFPEGKCPKAMSGDLWMTSSNRADESFSIPVSFE